jgi:phosphoglycolate phosphatase-like HAD superfamily hydrolase
MAPQPKAASENDGGKNTMSDVWPERPAKPSTLSRRALLGVASAALLGSFFPVRGVGAIGGRWAVEVDAPHPGLAAQTGVPLASWNDGPRKQAILDFVAAATDEGTTDFVPVADRISTFDMDGTLWVEMPIYTENAFIYDRIKALSAEHADWKTKEPFASILATDGDAILSLNDAQWEEMMAVTQEGLSIEDYVSISAEWLASAKHPRFDRLYTELVYQPMLELMAYLRENEFRTFIVSGSGQEFMRAFANSAFGVAPEEVIGSTFQLKYQMGSNGVPDIVIESAPLTDNNFAGKPEDIALFIGIRPAAAFGNSTGDQQMLEWANGGNRAMLMMLVYHDDAVREYAYGPAGGLPNTHVGTFTQTLMNEADDRGWGVISMKEDWKQIFA